MRRIGGCDLGRIDRPGQRQQLKGRGACRLRHFAAHVLHHLLFGVARQNTEVDRRFGAARQHVFFIAGVDNRQGGGRAHHGVGAASPFELLLHDRAEQP